MLPLLLMFEERHLISPLPETPAVVSFPRFLRGRLTVLPPPLALEERCLAKPPTSELVEK